MKETFLQVTGVMTMHYQDFVSVGIRQLHPYVPGKPVEELAREKGLKDIIKLASNENPLGCSLLAQQALADLSVTQIAQYPSALNHPLYKSLAQQLGIAPQQLFLSSGSDYIFWFLLTLFGLRHPQRRVLTHQYAFITYAIQAQTLGVPLLITPVDAAFRVDIDAMIAACNEQDVALIFIANPNNPTGISINEDQIRKLLQSIPASTILVLDEAYYEYAYPEGNPYSFELQAQYRNLVITRTFSKIYGLAAVRLGYAIADPEIIELLWRIQLPFTVSNLALDAGLAAFGDDRFYQSSLTVNQEGKAQLLAGFQHLQLSSMPSHANFLTVHFGKQASSVYSALLDHGIIVRPLTPYHLDDYLRITVGTKQQNIRLLQALETIMERVV